MSEMRQPAGVPEWTLGWRLRRSLGHAGISVQGMADLLGYSRSQVSAYLNDKQMPRRSIVSQWALICEVDANWLRTGDPIGPDGPGEQVKSSTKWYEASPVVPLHPSRLATAA